MLVLSGENVHSRWVPVPTTPEEIPNDEKQAIEPLPFLVISQA
jgi:hypothetical protein